MKRRQFNDAQRTQAIDLIESLPWGDVREAIRGLEVALALALEAVGDAVDLWEEEGEERFEGEFQLSTDQVASLDHEWRLAYIGRLLRTAAYAYGVPPHGTPGRTTEGEVTPPISWHEDAGSIARLVRGLNDILYGIPAPSRD